MPRRRKRSTWGCVTRLAPDRWRLRWVQGGKRRTEVVHGTRRQADDRLAQLRVEVGSDAKSRVTLGQAYERWWLPRALDEVAAGRASAQTQRSRECYWRRHVSPRWAGVPVAAIRPLDVQEWLDGLPPGPAKKSRALMRAILDLCVLFEVADRNVMDGRYRLPSSPSREMDGAIWTVGELGRVWAAVRGSFVEAPVILMAFGSARVGESLGARAEEVFPLDVGHGTVAVVPIVRQVLNVDGSVSDALKTDWSPRPAVIPGPMGERVLAIAAKVGSGWLCGDGVGGVTTQACLLREFYRCLRRAGVARHPPRNLRKSWETLSRWTLRIPVPMVERMMGHLEPGVTARHYDRPDEADFARAVSAAYQAHPYADGWAG